MADIIIVPEVTDTVIVVPVSDTVLSVPAPQVTVVVTPPSEPDVIVAPSEAYQAFQAGFAGPQGPGGVAGPRGPAGTAETYVHTQSFAASTWTVNHNLGHRPVVTVLTSSGVMAVAQIIHTSDNMLHVIIDNAMTGSVICI